MKKENNRKLSYLETLGLAFVVWHGIYLISAFIFFFVMGLYEAGARFAGSYTVEVKFVILVSSFFLLLRNGGYFKSLFEYKKLSYLLLTAATFIFYVTFVI